MRAAAGLLFHVASLGVFLYSFVWLRQVGLLSSAVVLLMFTMWGLMALTCFLLVAIVLDVVHLRQGMKKTKSDADPQHRRSSSRLLAALHHSYELLFALAFFLAVAVTVIFWSLFHYDRELIFPRAFVFPALLNHFQHTLPVIVLLIELVLFAPASMRSIRSMRASLPLSRQRELGLIMTVVAGYLAITTAVYFKAGRWPYPFMLGFTFPIFLAFAGGAMVVALLVSSLLRVARLALHALPADASKSA